jgi:hypothetical protein
VYNNVPVVNVPVAELTATEGTAFTIDIPNLIGDVPADVITFQWEVTGPNGQVLPNESIAVPNVVNESNIDKLYLASSSKPKLLASNEGTYTVRLRVADDDMPRDANGAPLVWTDWKTFTINVRNSGSSVQPLTLTPTGPQREGTLLTLGGSVRELGIKDAVEIRINWGDGSAVTILPLATNNSVLRSFADIPSNLKSLLQHRYADNRAQAYSVVVSARDGRNAAGVPDTAWDSSRTILATIVNDPPTLTGLQITPIIVEGGTARLSGVVADAGVNDALTMSIDWNGDNVFDQTIPIVAGPFEISHVYDNQSPTLGHSVGVKVSDNANDFVSQIATIVVNNFPPRDLFAGSEYRIVEGSALALSGFAIDVPADQPSLLFAWDIDLDGNQTYAGDDELNLATGKSPNVTWSTLNSLGISGGPATYGLRMRVTDDAGAEVSTLTTLTIENKLPVVSIGDPSVTLEGTALVSLNAVATDDPTDLHTFSWRLWRNGQELPADYYSGENTATLTFEPLDDGRYSAQVTVNDGAESVTVSKDFLINNVNPNIVQWQGPLGSETARGLLINQGQTADLNGSVTDASRIDAEILRVAILAERSLANETTNTTSRVPAIRNLDGSVALGLAFPKAGIYRVRLEARDDDGGISNNSPTLIFRVPGVTLSSPVNPQDDGEFLVNELAADNFTLRLVSPQGFDADDLGNIRIDWGDGTPDTILSVGERSALHTSGQFEVKHSYGDNGINLVSVTFEHANGTLFSLGSSAVRVSYPNAAPVLGLATDLHYMKNSPASPINPVLTLVDLDNTKLVSGVVRIANFVAGQDILEFNPDALLTGNIRGTFDPTTGVLSLTSTAPTALKSHWEAALRAVKYRNLSNRPAIFTRYVEFQVNDGQLASNTLVSTVTINGPTLSSTVNAISYSENGSAKVINSAVTVAIVADANSQTLASGRVTITNFVAGQDVLDIPPGLTTIGNITWEFDGATGNLTLKSADATATKSQWQAALRAVRYSNTSDDPTASIRVVEFSVHDGARISNKLTTTITVTAVNDAPNLTGSNNLAYTENDPFTVITPAPGLIVADVDNATLASATVTLTTFVTGQDQLSFVHDASTMGNIAGTITNGVVTLTSDGAIATKSEWQAALRAVAYRNLSDNPTTTNRLVKYVVNDGSLNSAPLTSTITITSVNDQPIRTAGTLIPISTNEDS